MRGTLHAGVAAVIIHVINLLKEVIDLLLRHLHLSLVESNLLLRNFVLYLRLEVQMPPLRLEVQMPPLRIMLIGIDLIFWCLLCRRGDYDRLWLRMQLSMLLIHWWPEFDALVYDLSLL